MMSEKFLEEAPPGYEPTMELKWIKHCQYPEDEGVEYVKRKSSQDEWALCQKWSGAFRSVWVRVPTSE